MQGRGVDITDALVAAILLKYGNMEIEYLKASQFGRARISLRRNRILNMVVTSRLFAFIIIGNCCNYSLVERLTNKRVLIFPCRTEIISLITSHITGS